MVTTRSREIARREIVYGVTVGDSAHALLRGQLRWLQERDWGVTLVTAPGNLAEAAAKREGVRLIEIDMKRTIAFFPDIRALYGWIRLLRRQRPFCVNVGTPKAGLLGGIAAWVTKVPKRIYVVRGLRLESATGPLKFFLWFAEKISISVATDVVVVSRSLAQELVSRRLAAPTKTWLIGEGSSNGVDSEGIQSSIAQVDRQDLRASLGLGSEKCVVGYIGRITKDKGIETLISAMELLPLSTNLELLCIGTSEDIDLTESIEALGGNARIIPWTNEVWKILSVIDILCLPTLREGFPNVVLEAAAAGIPAITTRATGAIDAVVEGKTGILIDVGDAKGLVKELVRLGADAKLRHDLGQAAKKRVQQDFQPVSIWIELEAIMMGNQTCGNVMDSERKP